MNKRILSRPLKTFQQKTNKEQWWRHFWLVSFLLLISRPTLMERFKAVKESRNQFNGQWQSGCALCPIEKASEYKNNLQSKRQFNLIHWLIYNVPFRSCQSGILIALPSSYYLTWLQSLMALAKVSFSRFRFQKGSSGFSCWALVHGYSYLLSRWPYAIWLQCHVCVLLVGLRVDLFCLRTRSGDIVSGTKPT